MPTDDYGVYQFQVLDQLWPDNCRCGRLNYFTVDGLGSGAVHLLSS